MTSLSRSGTLRHYSWWWDSHIPKNSKWLQENLTDMDSKVKQMIKLIEEDADSFARRAEMYYKKRPELMKLVEEFYRAYRALAERYDHATVELRQAHRTMAQAFPNQVPCVLDDDSPYNSSGPDSEPHTPDALRKTHGWNDPVELHKDAAGLSSTDMHVAMKDRRKWTSKRSIKKCQEMFESGEEALDRQSESTDDVNAEMDVQTLKNTLAKIQAEKEAVLSQYTETIEKLSDLEKELHAAQNNTRGLDEQASRAESEIKALKEALKKLEAERDAALHKYHQCLERLSSLETLISEVQMDAKGLNERATKAETEAQVLKEELSKAEADNEAALLKYNQCLEKISALEYKILVAEKEAGMLRDQTERAENEVTELRQIVARLIEEKEDVALQYKKCLETIAEMAAEISCAHEEAKQLRDEIQSGAAKLVSAEEQCISFESANHSLQEEADKLANKIENKDQELSRNQEELEKFKAMLQDEHSRFIQVEATLQNLQQLYSQSQEAQRALALELKDVLQVLKDLEVCKHNLEEEMQRIKDENQSLTNQNLYSDFSLNNLQNEISNLKSLKEKLEQELVVQAEHTNALQQEISRLKEEIEGLNMRYQALILQVEAAGLKPECLASSVKELQDEKLQLKDLCEKEAKDRKNLAEQLKNMDRVLEKNALMESSLTELNNMLQVSREKIQELQESCQMLQGDKSNLVAEKAALLSQLQIMTETMQKLLERNTVLESSLSGANIELEGLRTKSKSLEEYCQLLSNEKSSLLTERSILVSQLDSVEQRLGSLERRFMKLDEKYDGLEKEKKDTLCQVKELCGSFSVEKEERASYVQSTETRMTGLESIIQILQEENTSRKIEVDQELDKAVNAQVEIFILQKFIQDLEEKNLSLLTECQKHIEASKMSDKLITELEGENLEQQMEAEFLLDEIEKLRMGIHQVFTALRIDPAVALQDNFLADEIPLQTIVKNIEDIKSSLQRYKDDNHQLLVEKSVLSSALEQLRSDSADLRSENNILEKELKMMTEQQGLLQKDKHHLMDTNCQLRLDVSRGEQQEAALKNEIENLHVKLVNLQQLHEALQKENCKTLEDNRSLAKKISNVNQENYTLQEEINSIVQEQFALSNLSMVLEIFGTEKSAKLKALAEDHSSLQEINSDLRNKLCKLEERLKIKESENLHLKKSVESFEKKLHEITDMNSQLDVQITVAEDFLRQKEIELSEAMQKLGTTQQFNLELSRDVEELKKQYEESKSIKDDLDKQILVMSEDNCIKTMEVERLREQNECLESEVGRLEKEIEQHVLREDNLCSELQEKNMEFELWDAEATSFYFDSQISSVLVALLKNKLYEVNGVYENLQDENSDKSLEIEQMKGKINSLESEIGGMRAQMSAYGSVIDSLRDDVASLENNAFHLTKLQLAGEHCQQDAEAAESTIQLHEDQSVLQDKISELLKVQTRIRAVGKAMVDQMERVVKNDSGNTRFKQKAAVYKSSELQSQDRAYQDVNREGEGGVNVVSAHIKQQKTKPELFEVKNGTHMKDIPLDEVSHGSLHGVSRRRPGRVDDQMLELWETVEQDPVVDKADNRDLLPMRGDDPYRPRDIRHKSKVPPMEHQVEKELSVDKLELSSSAREPNQEGKRKILERLASDAQKITRLQTTVKELRKRMDMLKRGKKAKNIEYETVNTQLQEVEKVIVQLTNINDELTKHLDGNPLSWDGRTSEDFEEAINVRRRRATEQARKESEKIEQLQFDLQNIQYVLLKLEDENKGKGRNRFSESRTGILLKNFIYSGKRGSRRKKKARFCGCMRTSSNKSLSSQLQ